MFYGAGNYTNKAWSYLAQTLRKMILVSSETTHDIFSNAKDIYRRRFDPGAVLQLVLDGMLIHRSQLLQTFTNTVF